MLKKGIVAEARLTQIRQRSNLRRVARQLYHLPCIRPHLVYRGLRFILSKAMLIRCLASSLAPLRTFGAFWSDHRVLGVQQPAPPSAMVGVMHFGPYAMMPPESPPHNVQATQDAQQGPQLLVINAQIAQSRLASEDTHLTGSDARAVESQEPRDSVRASVFAVDPIARLFGCAPEIIGDVSYCQYLLQWIAYDLWPLAKLPAADLMAFLAFLLLLSYVLAKGVLGWAKGLWLRQKERPALTMLLPAFTTVVLLVVGVIYSLTAPGGGRSGAPGSALPPDYVALDDGAVDLKLNWTSSTTRRADARQIINPFLLLARDGSLLCAACQHAIIRRVGEEKECH